MANIVFGPVPSRRLGQSLGINNIPPKICTYSCVYCQVGRTQNMQTKRQSFYPPEDILDAVRARVEEIHKTGSTINYLTFVPDGEPTLDINLKREIALLKPLGIPIAVISNSSLIWQKKIREDLMEADWVSLKIDAVDAAMWRRVNRPHKSLNLDNILEGALSFSQSYKGELVTETMLVDNLNDDTPSLRQVGSFLSSLSTAAAYVAIPTRPPAEAWVRSPDEISVNRAYQILKEKVEHLEYLTGYEGNAFASTGDARADLLSITAVHPMRKEAVDALLKKAGTDWAMVHELIAENKIIEAKYLGHTYYVRRFRS